MTPRHVSRADVVDAVRGVAERFPERTVFVGVDGFGAAGKSALADVIAAAVPRTAVVRVDDFSGPDISEWDWGRFRAQLLAPLLAGSPARYQVCGWDADADGGAGGIWRDVRPGQVVIVEGVSSTRAEAGVPWDLTVWVDAPDEIRLARARERDGAAMLSRWLDAWIPSEQAYARRERPRDRVDLIVSGVE